MFALGAGQLVGRGQASAQLEDVPGTVRRSRREPEPVVAVPGDLSYK